jgi:CHAT domain-containing protein/Tfp pilus assembly protein PilF
MVRQVSLKTGTFEYPKYSPLSAFRGCCASSSLIFRTFLFGLVIVQLIGCESPKPAPNVVTAQIESPEILIARSDSLFEVAERFRFNKKHEDAIRIHEQVLEVRQKASANDERILYSNWRIAQALVLEQKVEAGDARFDEARRISETLALPFDTLASLLISASNSKNELKDFMTGRSLAARALQMVENHPDAYVLKARCYRALGNMFYNEEKYEEAIGYFFREGSIPESPKKKAILARAYYSIALCLSAQGKLRQALDYLNKSQTLSARLYGASSDRMAAVMLNKSGAFMQLGQMDSAKYCIQKNFEIRTRLYQPKSIFRAGAYEMVGKFFEANKRYDSALVYYQGTLTSFVKNFNESNHRRNPRPSPTEVTSFLADFLINKGHLLKLMYDTDTTRTDTLQLALKTYQLADSVFQAYQNNLAYDDPKLANLAAKPISYEDMASIASTLFRTTGQEQYLEALFHIMEQSRSSVLKGALARASSYQEKAVPDSLRIREKHLQEKRTQLVSMAAEHAGDGPRTDSIGQAVLKLDRDYQQLLTLIQEKDPGYALVRHGLNALSLTELRQLMKDKDGLWVEYLWGKEHIYAIAVDAERISSFRIKASAQLLKSIQWLSTNSRTATDSTFTKAYFRRYCQTSNSVYNHLLAPIIKDAKVSRIIICPEGALNSFPFDVLISSMPPEDEIDYHLDYLVNQFAISYHFSSAYLRKQAADKRHGNRLIALGYGTIDQPGGLASLPGTLEEVSAIEKTMDDESNTYLFDKDASEQSFKSKVEEYNILHLAVHGIADTTNAMNSKLVFRTAGEGEDGELFAHEVYGLNFDKMDLAVLSACESGTGKAQAGEGIMSMARGFAYAQCPSLVMSLWKINDKTSASVMSKFYAQLREGRDIDESLAGAKRDYLLTAKAFKSHPSYWAAFINMGETKALSGPSLPWFYITMGIFFTIMSLLYIRYQFEANKNDPAKTGSFVAPAK